MEFCAEGLGCLGVEVKARHEGTLEQLLGTRKSEPSLVPAWNPAHGKFGLLGFQGPSSMFEVEV